MGIIVGLDASRIRSGGGIAHLSGIIEEGSPCNYGIDEVHLWAYKALLDSLPTPKWLNKHNSPLLESTLIHQIWWQYHLLPTEVKRTKCNILFTADASSCASISPCVVLSQDMQSFEPGIMKQYGMSSKRLRLAIIGWLQTRSLRRAEGVVFLTTYAKNTIIKATGFLENVVVIPHGVDSEFAQLADHIRWPEKHDDEIVCIYVSNAAIYKKQWVVIRALAKIRREGFNVKLLLVGGGSGKAKRLICRAMKDHDPSGEYIQFKEFVSHGEILQYLSKSHLCVYASTCENMPVTLLESMAAGLPIACSNRGPMPEILKNAGVYFDPEDDQSIAEAIKLIILNSDLRKTISEEGKELAKHYTWNKCADRTWEFIAETYKKSNKKK